MFFSCSINNSRLSRSFHVVAGENYSDYCCLKGMWKAIIMLVLGVLSADAGLSRLEAISMIESGDNDRAVGGAGEVSRYQIMPRVWKRYSASTEYANSGLSTRVAEQHLANLESTFQKRTGRQPTDFDRYVLWNAGPVYYARIGFSAERVHPIIRERARRFVNLRQMQEHQVAQLNAKRSILAVGGVSR